MNNTIPMYNYSFDSISIFGCLKFLSNEILNIIECYSRWFASINLFYIISEINKNIIRIITTSYRSISSLWKIISNIESTIFSKIVYIRFNRIFHIISGLSVFLRLRKGQLNIFYWAEPCNYSSHICTKVRNYLLLLFFTSTLPDTDFGKLAVDAVISSRTWERLICSRGILVVRVSMISS